MTDNEKLEILADVLDMDVSEINPTMKLSSLESWDSVAALAFIAMMDEKFHKTMKGAELKSFVKVQDALDAML
jgi:acyl carrier protein